jgi:hypothetical protein
MSSSPPSTILGPSLTANAQWAQLHTHIKNLPLSGNRPIPVTWVDSVDRAILLAAIVKKTTEHDLLQSEAAHAHIASKCDIEFPNYDVALAYPHRATSPRETPQTERSSAEQQSSVAAAAAAATTQYDSGGISPISPTFGPRAGAILSGTVARRRSIPILPVTPNGVDDEDKKMRRLIRKDWEERLQFEAAWLYIEQNLEGYVEKFRVCDEEPGGSKTVLWEELVRLRGECEGLEMRIRAGREDVRG